MSLADDISTLLNDDGQSAAIVLFMDLLRDTPGLRQWLRIVMLDNETRHRLDAYIDGKAAAPARACRGRGLLSWMAGVENGQAEARRLREKLSVATPTHGGITHARLHALIRRHQAGAFAFAPFLLIAAWRRAATDKTACASALRATEFFLGRALRKTQRPRGIFINSPAPPLFFQGCAPGTIGKPHYGHAIWWQLNVLLYMLMHPKPTYRTREFVRHLASQKSAWTPPISAASAASTTSPATCALADPEGDYPPFHSRVACLAERQMRLLS
jgi:hypothetical protein